MNTEHLVLAIDQGGQSSRVAVYTYEGQQVCVFATPCETMLQYDAETGTELIEQSPLDILNGIKVCLENIRYFLGENIQHIKAAGFAGQGSSLLCWNNQTGAALTPVMSWQDIRGKNYLTEMLEANEFFRDITGLRLSPHYGASKFRWCLDNCSDVVHAYKNNQLAMGPIVSYIFWHLLRGNADNKTSLIDPGHAQRTLLWNLHDNAWDDSLLELFNLPKILLPECKFHNSHFGDLCLEESVIPFTASARDQGASLFAQGRPDSAAIYINLGTGAFIQCVSDNLRAPDGLLVSPLYLPEQTDQEKLYAWEATVNGAASAISFVENESGLALTPELLRNLLTLNPQRPCYFLNAVGGLGAPYWRTDLASHFSPGLLPPEKILAWVESVIFQIIINLNLMRREKMLHKIMISGGLANADGICQKIADLAGLPVYRNENTDATLQGIACMAAGFPTRWQTWRDDQVFVAQENTRLKYRFSVWQEAMERWLLSE